MAKYRILEYNDGAGPRYRPQIKKWYGWSNMRIGAYHCKKHAEEYIDAILFPDTVHEYKEPKDR